MTTPLLYLSGALPRRTQDFQVKHTQARLLSCHGAYVPVALRFLETAKQFPEWKQRPLMLDSGAFSAWKTGRSTSLDEVTKSYETVLRAADGVVGETWLVNLDTIPGSPGVDPTPQEIAAALIDSDHNFRKLEQRFGTRVLPVFHQGEDTGRLVEVCSQAAYIGVSPRNDLNENVRLQWSIETHVAIKRIDPSIRTHGLAATSQRQFTQVPWFSVDSASWTLSAAYGTIIVCFEKGAKSIGISPHTATAGSWDGHYDHLTPDARRIVDEQIAELGFSLDDLRNDFVTRATFNVPQFYRKAQYGQKLAPLQTSLF